jgi:hypothetical protein
LKKDEENHTMRSRGAWAPPKTAARVRFSAFSFSHQGDADNRGAITRTHHTHHRHTQTNLTLFSQQKKRNSDLFFFREKKFFFLRSHDTTQLQFFFLRLIASCHACLELPD